MQNYALRKTLLLTLFLFPLFSIAQMEVDNTLLIEDLVLDSLVGENITISNVLYNGAAADTSYTNVGAFNASNSNIPILSGIVMATGNSDVVIGPNNSGSSSIDGDAPEYTDMDVDSLISGTSTSNDLSVLEFDFIPEGNFISLEFVFSSEEYNEYVCASFNDAFGVFLSGPGIDGPFENSAINAGLINGTDIPVSINTVNIGIPGNFGNTNNCTLEGLGNSAYFVDNAFNEDTTSTQMDGFTLPILVSRSVQSGESYHLKITIADAADGSFDSAVFLKSKSFKATEFEPFNVLIHEVTDISCNEPGLIACQAIGGATPYTYIWNTVPISNDSSISIESSGIYTVEVSDSDGSVRTISFLIGSPLLGEFDMEANLIADPFRPGFSSEITIVANNGGCVLTEGSITLIMDSLLSFSISDTEPDNNLIDTLIWNYEGISSDSDHIVINIETLTDSLAVIGDTICFDLAISPLTDDIDPSNNFKRYCFPVVNGYDPNDKQVYPQGICEGHFVLKTEPLTYTIRFQNTGNAEAINIHIIDSLSSYLDINSVEVLASSHDMYTLVRPGNVLDFRFDDIHLPDSTSNEPESHGYVIFKVYPNSFTWNGTFVDNKSEIYFDFNPPIVTNTVFNTLVNVLLTCDINMGVDDDYNSVNDVLVYPNPSNGLITVEFDKLTKVDLALYNLNGQLVYSQNNISTEKYQFEVNEPAGIYILEISASEGKQYYKVVLE
jgi:uncharacterized repeat protein (TIGR01451 family)